MKFKEKDLDLKVHTDIMRMPSLKVYEELSKLLVWRFDLMTRKSNPIRLPFPEFTIRRGESLILQDQINSYDFQRSRVSE